MPLQPPDRRSRAEAAADTRKPAQIAAAADRDDEAEAIVQRFAARDARPSRGWVARGHLYLADERHAAMRRLIADEIPGVEHPRLVDVGCGSGYDLRAWRADGWPADALAGIDLVPGRVDAARQAVPGVDLRLGAGPDLPYADSAFDVATASTVFSSIGDAASRRRLFAEMGRVVRPGGLVIVYDFVVRNPRNRSVQAMVPTLLTQMAGRSPDGSFRLGPFLYAVGPALAIHPALGRLAARIMPRTHRLSYWRV